TMVPSIGTVSMILRIASTATWSDLCRSPWPMVCAQAIAACSTTRRNSSERSESIVARHRPALKGRATRLLPAHDLGFVSRQLAARRPIGAEAEQVIGLHDLVNLPRPLVDDRALAVT